MSFWVISIVEVNDELAVLVARYHSHCHHAEELKRKTLLKTLLHLDAFRRPHRFAQFLLACEADSRGRLGFENRPYPQADLFRRAFQIASQVDVTTIVAAGFQGEAIAEELYRRRLRAFAQQLKSHHPNQEVSNVEDTHWNPNL